LARERRSLSSGDGRNVLVEDVGDTVAGQGLAAVIDEDVMLVPPGFMPRGRCKASAVSRQIGNIGAR